MDYVQFAGIIAYSQKISARLDTIEKELTSARKQPRRGEPCFAASVLR